MASSVNVELEGEPLKKTAVKTTPAMSLKSIAVAACEKLKLPFPDTFGLRHQKHMLDLSLSVRFANLPAGAKLILVKVKSSPAAAVEGESAASSSTAKTLPTQVKVAEVNIALQIEDGTRLIKKFPANTTLWDIIVIFEAQDSNLNITRRTGVPPLDNPKMPKALKAIAEAARKNQAVYMFPVIVLMNKEFSSLKQLCETTLESAGLSSGSAALRLLFRYTEKSLSEMAPLLAAANSQTLPTNPPTSAATAPVNTQSTAAINTSPKPTSVQSTTSLIPKQDTSAKVEVQPTPVKNETGTSNMEGITESSEKQTATAHDAMEQEPQTSDEQHKDGGGSLNIEREAKVFRPPPDGAPISIELPDSFFELTGAELKMLVSGQKAKMRASENAPLMIRAMREREEELKRKKYPKTLIRIRFPDRTTLQASFLSTETVGALYQFVRESIFDPTIPFTLYMTPPMKVFKDMSASMWTEHLAPASMLYLKADGVDAPGTYFNPTYISLIEDFPMPQLPDVPVEASGLGAGSASNTLDDTVSNKMEVDEQPERHQNYSSTSQSSSRSNVSEKKVPKWFKMGKK